ncbi:MAG: hypothetical protein ATN35_12755 [Epulopiscium sp. Nele67-Bin004]|nr:MAG: hypothetical protein ATN35_12755 [Epulopiscium sp. Nele67-Bin004]
MGSDCIMLDVDNTHSDNPNNWVTPEDLEKALDGVVSFYYALSRNNNKSKNGKAPRPKYHVYFSINYTTNKEYLQELKLKICALFPYFDENAIDVTRFFFGHHNPICYYVEASANDVGIEEYIELAQEMGYFGYKPDTWEDEAIAFAPAKSTPKKSTKKVVQTTTVIPLQTRDTIYIPDKGEPIPEGDRNSTMHKIAVKLLKRNGISDATEAAFYERATDCMPPLDDRELSSIWNSAKKFQAVIEQSEEYLPPHIYTQQEEEVRTQLNDTFEFIKPSSLEDVEEARKFYEFYKEDAIYVVGMGWLLWEDNYWKESDLGVQRLLQKYLKYQQSVTLLKIRETKNTLDVYNVNIMEIGMDVHKLPKDWSDEAKDMAKDFIEAKLLLKFLKSKCNAGGFFGLFKMAASIFQVPVEMLDNKWDLLYTPDGVFDLKQESEILPHEPTDYSTAICTSSPSDDEMEMVYFTDFLDEIFMGDEALIIYVQELCGMALFGKVFKECMIIAYGDGKNGKSTLFNQGLQPESSTAFGKALRSCGFESSKIKIDGKQIRVWKSIKIS